MNLLSVTLARTAAALGTCLIASAAAAAEPLSFQDPKGDDNGWGKGIYPTGKEYAAGAFDLTGLEIKEDGDMVVIEIEVASPLTDPWKSKEWGGNGFSLQFVHVYFDTDGKPRSGERRGVPGSWVEFSPDSYWEKVVLISPQPATKLRGEVEGKARFLSKKVIIPERTEARGRKIIARVKASELGKPSAKWGVQALMLSNEGFPDKEDILSRRTNEFEGEHRFGGGCDGVGDPQVMDLLIGDAKAAASEIAAQHEALSAYKCAETAKGATFAKIPMVRR